MRTDFLIKKEERKDGTLMHIPRDSCEMFETYVNWLWRRVGFEL